MSSVSVVDVVLGSVDVDTHPVPEGPGQVPDWSRPPSSHSCVGARAGQGALDGGGDLRLQTGDDASDQVRLINRGTGAAGGGGGGAEPARGGSAKS